MDTLTSDILSAIVSNIKDEAIFQLSITSKNMGNATKALKEDTIFYKQRVENLLGYSVLCTQRNLSFASINRSYGKPAKLKFSYKEDWKGFYYILIKSDVGTSNWLDCSLLHAAKDGNNLATKVLLADKRGEILVSRLTQYAVDTSFRINSASLLHAAKDGNNLAKVLLAEQRGEILDYAIIKASANGHTEIVKLLLDDPRVDPSVLFNEAIMDASANGHTEIVKLLLEDSRVDPSAGNNYSIHMASVFKYSDIVRLLLGSNKINMKAKEDALTHNSVPGLNYSEFMRLTGGSLDEFIIANITPLCTYR